MSRGQRNNNPLNIRHGTSRWEGRTRVQTDAEFVTFKTMAYGYRAAWRLMETYRLRLMQAGKSYTLENIIRRWAPPEDGNDTQEYIRTVIRLLNYKVAGRQPLPSPASSEGHTVFTHIIAAMTCVECGIRGEEVDRESIERGWAMAFGEREATPPLPLRATGDSAQSRRQGG